MTSYREAAQMIAAGNFVPAYLFYGGEPYLIQDLSNRLALAYLGKEENYGREKVEGADLTLAEVLQRLHEESLFAPRKLLLVDEPPYLAARGKEVRDGAGGGASPREEGGEKALERLECFIEREGAAETPSRIILFRAAAVDRRRRLFKVLERRGMVVDCAPLRESELARWIRERLAGQGIKIETAALQRLLWSGENDLHFISNELDKYISYLGEGESTITSGVVELLCSGDMKGNVFALADALGSGNVNRSLQLLALLSGRREEPLRIFFMLVRHFRLLLGACSLREEKIPLAKHAGALGVQPFVARKLYDQSASFSPDLLEEIIIFLQQLDYRIKTGRVAPEQALDIAIAGIHRLSPKK